ncbi:MAG: hypothetical protein IPO12_01885 [Flavobacteriales bacterium]|nr:hypothetical protein [Flavobacteriales bacterium]
MGHLKAVAQPRKDFLLENSIIDGGIILSQSGISSALVPQCILLDMVSVAGGNNGVTFMNNVITRTSPELQLEQCFDLQQQSFSAGFHGGPT